MRSFIPALLLLLVASCATVEPECGSDGETDGVMCESELYATITVSSAFAPLALEWSFPSAAVQWSDVTDGRSDVRFVVVDGPADIEPGTPICSGRVFSLESSPGRTKQAALHYLGHRFGLGHSTDGANLMSAPIPVWDYSDEMSVRDAAHFDRLYATYLP